MSEEELKVLKKKRASIKAKLTIFEKFVKSVEGLQSDTELLARSKIIEIEQRLQDAQQLNSEFDDTQTGIECILDDFESQMPEREEFTTRFYQILTLTKTILDANTPKELNDRNSDVVSHISAQSSAADLSDAVKLPEIELPKFDGLFPNWLEFRDIFQSLIHENTRINNIQKFHYLRASLVGAAPQVIQSIEFCGTNYEVAWQTLCERFNNTNLLIQNHLNAVFNSETINTESASKIRNLSDNLFKHLTSLKQLGEPTEHWDTLIIYIVSAKLDPSTARDWERLKTKQKTSCTLEFFKNFLKEKADILENTERNLKTKQNDLRQSKQFNYENKRTYKTSRGFHANTNTNGKTNNTNLNEGQSKYTCFFCNGNHSLFYCADYLKLSTHDRFLKAKELQLCVNCLRRNHTLKDCRWSGFKICSLKHNTILHGIKEYTNTALTVNQKSENPNNLQTNNNATCTFATAQNALLSTAQVYCRDVAGNFITARALLDNGSQSSFMTSALCNKLKLPTTKTDLTITGISDKTARSTERCRLKIRSKIDMFSFDVSCFVLEKITNDLPGMIIDREALKIPHHFKLADPTFEISSEIDLLLGADVFWNLLTSGKQELGNNGPILQNTRIGWIVSGPLTHIKNSTICNLSKNTLLQNQLTKFWEVEEISNKKPFSNEETLFKKHFIDTLEYSSDGRFVVSLPLKDSPQKLGNTRELAIKRFVSLERKLLSNDKLQTSYVNFLQEYELLGHMTEIRDDSENTEPEYYLPHHGVLKETSTTTKLRVVFNASAPSTTGLSLNNLQMTGPTIQSDLLSILLRFRMRNIVLSADIKMMYRQVLINPNQRNLQKIVWRSNPNEPIKTYQLNTVTYGTTAGSFLAIRSLFQVAIDCENEHPKIAKIIKEDMYVDDLLTCVDSPEEAEYVTKAIYEILLNRGFELRKWQSNALSFNGTNKNSDTVEFTSNKDHDTKVLGLLWVCSKDILTFKISSTKEMNPKSITKRVVLSRIATIFDPLGLTSPCIIIAKVLLQKLWAENLTWDQPLPSYILSSWIQFSSELDLLNQVMINRQVTCQNPSYITLHGFSDASETSYGACIYVLSENKNGGVTECNLLCAKSKVAPIKSLTIPRLELCAALILAQLLTKVLESIDINIDKVYCWSDSTIVLGWLNTSPNLLKQFVDNRVAEIQKLTKGFVWNHVPTQENPADLVSRGLRPNQLIRSDLWWHGPK